MLDISTIESPYGGKPLDITPLEHSRVVKRLKIRPMPVSWSAFHMSVKRGPMGPAMFSANWELHLISELVPDLILVAGDKFGSWIKHLLGGTLIGGVLVSFLDYIPKPRGTPCLRKLSHFSDKEGKTRVIGICDYWTQSALKPVHSALAEVLRGISADCTFNQGRVTRALSFPGPYFSFDLSNATDRMPLLLQKKVVASILGIDRTEAWARLLCQYGFASSAVSHPVFYKCGQPMGAYSS